MYIKHDDEWWERETRWVEREFKSTRRIGAFKSYLEMQITHCRFNGPADCTERLEAVHEKLTGEVGP